GRPMFLIVAHFVRFASYGSLSSRTLRQTGSRKSRESQSKVAMKFKTPKVTFLVTGSVALGFKSRLSLGGGTGRRTDLKCEIGGFQKCPESMLKSASVLHFRRSDLSTAGTKV